MANQLKLSPVILSWLAKADSGNHSYDAEGIFHDLQLMMSMATWRGVRKTGGLAYSTKKIMDRLEVLQKQHPHIRFFTGVFPRAKGQPCRQILWYSDSMVGTEEELG